MITRTGRRVDNRAQDLDLQGTDLTMLNILTISLSLNMRLQFLATIFTPVHPSTCAIQSHLS